MDAMDLRTAEGKVHGLMRTAWYQITACNAVGRVAASFGLDKGTAGVAVAIQDAGSESAISRGDKYWIGFVPGP